ncbi:MAG: hypothetical protein HWN81_10035 [Candidatus Lokiarchaeota archaeon]|nr:hypothetical protein [Candidatus Lokiarchaeota archaeon]
MPLTMPPNKTFEGDFYSINKMLKEGENFSFSRFSDGEVFIMQGQEVVMAADHCKVKGVVHKGVNYAEDDHKHFDPSHHEFYRQKLIDSFIHRQNNYIKGISCRCCIGQRDFNWQLGIIKGRYNDLDQEHLSWSNLMINANYFRFINEMTPVFKTKKIVMIVNKNASLSELGFDIVKDFRIGKNCMVNDYSLIDTIEEWVGENDIKNHLFLFAAASLSNIAIHRLYSKYPENTYMDIGSSLNPFMPGIGSRRRYMNQINAGRITYETCIW